ncbi:COMM domain-containing protein 8 [Eucyclogobius newberryi]|uniref:COMM domain-containing protein 8 n=1 Tax=Eucyclogobius newberryi TaxID=166745 RepID=UPI003B5A8A09
MTLLLLNKLSDTDCRKLCHAVVDGVCGRKQPQREDYSATCSLDEWLDLNKSLSRLFCFGSGGHSSDEKVLAALSDTKHKDVLLSVLKARRQELSRALLDKTTSISSAVLTDFDWQLKLALSSDKISSLQTPLLSLSLDVREKGVLRPVTMEMTREELNTLITSLEAANKVVLQLK